MVLHLTVEIGWQVEFVLLCRAVMIEEPLALAKGVECLGVCQFQFNINLSFQACLNLLPFTEKYTRILWEKTFIKRQPPIVKSLLWFYPENFLTKPTFDKMEKNITRATQSSDFQQG